MSVTDNKAGSPAWEARAMSERQRSTRDLLVDATLEIRRLRQRVAELTTPQADEPIAIVGMACRFPGEADSPETFWQNLVAGRDAMGPVPADRWDNAALFDADPATPGRLYTREAGFLADVQGFDPLWFGIAPRDAERMDPQQRLLLELAHEALEDAGLPPFGLKGSATGVYVGICFDDHAQRLVRSGDLRRIDAASALGNNRAVAAGRVAYTFGLQGPVLQLDTTCSSSLLAMHLACQSLRLGEAELALAGGVNLMLSAEATVGFCRLGALSTDGRCRAFDAGASGYARGEGGGLVVLKRLSKARADGDRILAVWRGSAVNHDGASNGLTAPSGPAQVAVIREALRRAGLTPTQVQHVEAHGTATPLGDPIELMALNEAYGQTPEGQVRVEPLVVGSVKTHIGHLESAAGAAGLIKAVLSLQHGHIPPHLHFEQPTPRVPWARMGLTVPAHGQAWPASEGPRRAGISGFGMSGTNVHVVLEQAPDTVAGDARSGNAQGLPPLASRGLHVLAFGARHQAGLQARIRQWRDWLGAPGQPLPEILAGQAASGDGASALAAICHQANRTRSHGPWRCAWVVRDLDDLRRQLAGDIAGVSVEGSAPVAEQMVPRRAIRPGLVWQLPARVDQPQALLTRLSHALPAGQHWLARCEALYQDRHGSSLWNAGPLPSQALQLAVLLGLALVWRAAGLRPDAVRASGLAQWVRPVCEGRADAETVFQQALDAGIALSGDEAHVPASHADVGDAMVLDLAAPFLENDAASGPWLTVLARLHEAGFDIDWRAVDSGFVVTHADLPSTGFVRRRCWIPPDVLAAVQPGLDGLDAWVAGVNTDLADDGLRMRTITVHPDQGPDTAAGECEPAAGRSPRWSHHQVLSQALWPAAAHLSALWALARDAGWQGARVRSLSLMQGLWLPRADGVPRAPVQVQTLARQFPDEQDQARWQLRVASQGAIQPPLLQAGADTVDTSTWRTHVQAELDIPMAGDITPPEWTRPIDLAANTWPEHLDGQALYQRFAQQGLVYGPDFALIDTVGFDGTRALARLRGGGHTVAVLDAGLQLAGLWLAREQGQGGQISLPVAMDEAGLGEDTLHDGLGRAAWVQATRRGEGERWQLDLSWHDGQGRLLAWTQGWRLMPVRLGQVPVATASSPQVQTWPASLCELRWQPRDHAVASTLKPWIDPDAVVMQAGKRLKDVWHGDDCQSALALQPLLTRRALAWALCAVTQLDRQHLVPSGESDATARLQAWGVVPAQAALSRRLIVLADHARAQGLTADPPETASAGQPISREQQVLDACGAQLPAIVRGELDPLGLLFPDGDLSLLTALYEQAPGARVMNTQVREALHACVEAWRAGRGDQPLRIVEIGAGTGGTTAHLLPMLAEAGVPVVYTFTDVSTHFLHAARERFSGYPWLRCELLDIEQDPHVQGRLHADVVVAANVLHATTRVDRTLDHVRRLLAPSGILILLEATEALPWLDLVFGTTAGWWAFQDEARRPAHPLLSAEAWTAALREAGFDAVMALQPPQALPQTVLVARRGPAALCRWAVRCEGDQAHSRQLAAALSQAGGLALPFEADLPAGTDAGVDAAPGTDAEGRAALAPLEHVEALLWTPSAALAEAKDPAASFLDVCSRLAALARHLITLAHPPRLVVWSALDAASAEPQSTSALLVDGLWGAVQSIRAECPTLVVHLVQSHGAALPLAALLNDAAPDTALRQASAGLAGGAGEATWLVPRLEATDAPMARRWAGDALSLSGLHERALPVLPLADDAVRIRVKAAGLNFRDVLIAMGEYPHPDPAQPDPLGAECVGVVEAVGASVVGLRPGQAVMALATGTFGQQVDVPAALVAPVPKPRHDGRRALAWDEAATMPVAFATAWHALVECAGLRAGECVLIHSAAGGVGQAAVQIARALGAEVFGTSSQAKWPALRDLGIAQPMDSRRAGFAALVRERTGGRGVDVVLNALPGALQRESLGALQPHGRFIEIGKGEGLDDAGFAQAAPGVRLHRVDLAQLTRHHPQRAKAWWQALDRAWHDGSFTPLPRQTWPMGDAVQALRALQQGRQVGKLVLLADGVQPGAPAADVSANDVATFKPREDGCYLVTGGLGGLGLLTARWLAQQGAGELLLLGRTLPTDSTDERAHAWQAALTEIQASGTRVHATALDVADEAALAALLATQARGALPGLRHPLRGVFHAAGVLDDAPLAKQDAARLARVLMPKTTGAWNLHCLTQGHALDAFVLFASAAGMLGAPGQFNHAAANAWLDGFARWRRAQGLPAHSVAWGAWAGVGSALRYARDGQVSGMAGVGFIAPDDGLAVLERVLQDARPQFTALAVDWPRFLAHPWTRRSALLDSLRAQHAVLAEGPAGHAQDASHAPRPASTSASAGVAAQVFRRRVQEADAATKVRLLDELVAGLVAETLGLRQDEVDRHAGFFDLGLDSLSALEIKNRLQATLGLNLPGTLAFDHPTPSALVAHLSQRMAAAPSVQAGVPSTSAVPQSAASASRPTPPAMPMLDALADQPTPAPDAADIAAQLDARLDALDALLSDPPA
ncbi:MAG: SDR family NAD(P)-dependent oxidoreductase [Pseudomonadota bacterium]